MSMFEKWLARRWPEITALAVLYGIFAGLRSLGLSILAAVLVVLLLLLVLLLVPTVRHFVARFLRRQRWSIRLARSLAADTVLAQFPPRVLSVQKGPHSTTLNTRLHPLTTADNITRAAEHIASALSAGAVRVLRDPANASNATIKIISGSPLSGQTLAWPGDPSVQTSAWDLIAFGVGEEGDSIRETLAEHNLFVAGEPGGGKTEFAKNIVREIVRDPSAKLWIGDFKDVDFRQFKPLCAGYAGAEIDAQLEVATLVRDEMVARYTTLADRGLRKVTRDSGIGLGLFVADEIGSAFAQGKPGKELAEIVRDILARGRAAGIVAVLSTQRPGSDTFPTAIRDLVGFRIAFRCPTRDASDIVLGSGWATQGFNAATIAIADRGVGYFLGEGGLPRLFRAYWMDDVTEAKLIASAMQICGLGEKGVE